MNRLGMQDRARILGCLVKGNSLRATTRLIGCSINTVTKFLVDLGAACATYQDETLRNLSCKRIRVDEIWSFCYSKQSNTPPNTRGPSHGDVYTWVALDADTKLVPSWLVGTRDAESAHVFVRDLASRLSGRLQLSSDGHKANYYVVENVFGGDVDYASWVKLSGTLEGNQQERRYSPAKCTDAIAGSVSGDTDSMYIFANYVDCQNSIIRMSKERLARLSNGFSKKIAIHGHAIAMQYMFYNFGRIYKSLRVTPAMQAGISDHIWSLEEIAALAN